MPAAVDADQRKPSTHPRYIGRAKRPTGPTELTGGEAVYAAAPTGRRFKAQSTP
jgi:hypothetical protein